MCVCVYIYMYIRDLAGSATDTHYDKYVYTFYKQNPIELLQQLCE